jgi:hypothetical protein
VEGGSEMSFFDVTFEKDREDVVVGGIELTTILSEQELRQWSKEKLEDSELQVLHAYFSLVGQGITTLEIEGEFEKAVRLVDQGQKPIDVVYGFRSRDATIAQNDALQEPPDVSTSHERSSVNWRYNPESTNGDRSPSPRRGQVHTAHDLTGYLEVETQTPANGDSDLILQYATGKGTTNSVLDVVGFSLTEQNFLFNVYGKGIVRSAISIYFRANPNEHQRKVRENETSTDFRHGLVATMEALRTSKRGNRYHNVQNAVLDGDIHFDIQNRYRDKSPIMRVRDPVQMEVTRRLDYLVQTYILGENLDISGPHSYVAVQSQLTARPRLVNGNGR